jgi:ABC-type nitrate/sulfonate/bicarbonate transport system permease component
MYGARSSTTLPGPVGLTAEFTLEGTANDIVKRHSCDLSAGPAHRGPVAGTAGGTPAAGVPRQRRVVGVLGGAGGGLVGSRRQHQAQFLLPQVGVRRIGGNFVALTAIVASLRRVLAGLALAFVAALLTGSLAFYLKVFHKLTFPMLTLLAPIAPVAWIPFALVAFGIGDGAAIFVVFVGIFFTLELATVQSMYNVEQLYINTARVLGANRHQVLRYVIFPAILPNLFVIMRLNLFGAWMGVLAAEMVGVNTGLGTIVLVGRQMMNMNLTFLGMALIGLMGYLLDTGFALVQRRVLWWRSAAHL